MVCTRLGQLPTLSQSKLEPSSAVGLEVDEVCRTPYKSSLLEVRRHGGGSTAESKMEMLSVLLLCILLRAYDTEG